MPLHLRAILVVRSRHHVVWRKLVCRGTLLVFLLATGCRKIDDDWPVHWTANTLVVLSNIVGSVYKAEGQTYTHTSLDSLLRAACGRGFVLDWQLAKGEFLLDYWKQPLHYEVRHESHCSVVTIYSIGPDGINEGGKGDDVRIDIFIAPNTAKRSELRIHGKLTVLPES
jgi:hypothetical protein